MTKQDTAVADAQDRLEGIDIGRPVEWMVDPEDPTTVLGVTYEFSMTAVRQTVWYTPNKRRPKTSLAVRKMPSQE